MQSYQINRSPESLEEKDIFSHQHEIELERNRAGIRRQDTFKRKPKKFPQIKIVRVEDEEEEGLDRTITEDDHRGGEELNLSARSSQCSVDSSKTIVAGEEVRIGEEEEDQGRVEVVRETEESVKSKKFKSRKSKSLDHIFDNLNVSFFLMFFNVCYF